MKKTITNIFKTMWKVFKRFPNAFAVLVSGLIGVAAMLGVGIAHISDAKNTMEITFFVLAVLGLLMSIITFITNIRSKQSRELLETLDAKGKHEKKQEKKKIKKEKAEVNEAKHSVKAEVKKEKLKDILG